MPYKPIEIDRQNLSITGVNFISVCNFDTDVNTFGTVMFEGNQYQWHKIRGCQWLKK